MDTYRLNWSLMMDYTAGTDAGNQALISSEKLTESDS